MRSKAVTLDRCRRQCVGLRVPAGNHLPQAAFEFIDVLSARGRLLREARVSRWQSLQSLSERVEIRGPLVPDALLAATCLGFGASVLTADRDFLRFPGVRVHLMTSVGIVDHTVK